MTDRLTDTSLDVIARPHVIVDAEPPASPVTYTEVTGSPKGLAAGWSKAATITSACKSLLVSDVTQGAYDIFWTVVPAGAAAPSASVKGVAILGGEDFRTGIPLGDLYLRSATGSTATVMVGA